MTVERVFRTGALRAVALPLAALIMITSCGGSDAPSQNSAHVVQLTDVQVAPLTIQCRTFIPGAPVVRDIQFNIKMVNTTSDTVRVLSISSSGRVTRASKPELVGQFAFVFSSIPVGPEGAFLRPNDGEVTYTALMTTACVAGGTAVPDFIDVGVTLFVRTTAGEFATPMITISQAYQ